MQEDKESIFDSLDTLKQCLEIFAPMLKTATVRKDNMLAACKKGYLNATDCADYLVGKGMPFREAYLVAKLLVARASADGKLLEELPLATFQEVSPLFSNDIYAAIDMKQCLAARTSYGGPAPENVKKAIAALRNVADLES
jgi:argininosuccinate lyase